MEGMQHEVSPSKESAASLATTNATNGEGRPIDIGPVGEFAAFLDRGPFSFHLLCRTVML